MDEQYSTGGGFQANSTLIFKLIAVFCVLLFISLLIIGGACLYIRKQKAQIISLRHELSENKGALETEIANLQAVRATAYRELLAGIKRHLDVTRQQPHRERPVYISANQYRVIKALGSNPGLQQKLGEYVFLHNLFYGKTTASGIDIPNRRELIRKYIRKCKKCENGIQICPDCKGSKVCIQCNGTGKYEAPSLSNKSTNQNQKNSNIAPLYQATRTLDCPVVCSRCIEPLICTDCNGFGIRIYANRLSSAIHELEQELHQLTDAELAHSQQPAEPAPPAGNSPEGAEPVSIETE